MRCFYCARTGMPASNEHVRSAFLGSRLKTRRVCKECNERAAQEVDKRFADYLMVQMPKALADVRNIRRQGQEPSTEVDAIISSTGEPVRARFSPRGREARRLNGKIVHDVIEVKYDLNSDLWVQFIAKVALGCASRLRPEDWLDEPIARALCGLLWHGAIDNAVWPQGVPAWPDELEVEHPVRRALGESRHLIGITSADDDPGSSVAVAILFGGQIACNLPLPGLTMPGSGHVWILDWRALSPPQPEGSDAAIERLLNEQGWSSDQIDAVRLP